MVEEIKSARRYIKKNEKSKNIEECNFAIIDKHQQYTVENIYQEWLLNGNDVALMSEAGCPCIADPGYLIVAWAHQNNIKVIPLIGPNSILMALMASGLSGQRFAFHGYLPIEDALRRKKILQLEENALQQDYTQICIETPHRNKHIFEAIVNNCKGEVRLCIAQDITGADEWIKTQSIANWRKAEINFKKLPTIFLIGK